MANSGVVKVYRSHSVWHDVPSGEYSCGTLNLYRFKTLDGDEGILAAIDGIRMKTEYLKNKTVAADFYEPNERR